MRHADRVFTFLACTFVHTCIHVHVGHKGTGNPTPEPAHLPEKLRLALTEFNSQFDSLKSQLDTTRSLLVSSKESVKQLSLECSTYREVVTSRTAAMTVSALASSPGPQKGQNSDNFTVYFMIYPDFGYKMPHAQSKCIYQALFRA